MNTKRIFAVLFLVGLVCGLGIGVLLDKPEHAGMDAERSVSPDKIPEWGKERDELLAQLASQALQIASLQEELENAREEAPPPPPPEDHLLSPEDQRRWVQERMAERMDQRLNGRADEMAARYGLNEAQRLAIKELYQKQFENMRARRSGASVEPFNMDEALSTVMTDEQFAEYLEETQQDIYNRAELMATTTTVKLSQSTDLSADSLDMVYETLNLTAQEMMIARQEGIDFDMREVVNERMSSFLTEEQIEQVQENLRGPGGGGGMGMGRGGP